MQPGYRTIQLYSPRIEDISLGYDAILMSKWRPSDVNWHWVVWDAEHQRVLDPQDPPYKQYRFRSYLKVQR